MSVIPLVVSFCLSNLTIPRITDFLNFLFYLGQMCTNIISSNSYEDDPFDFIFLDKNTTYKILVSNVEDYYFWGNSKFIDISYLGPLGESNVLRVYLNHGRIKSLADEKNL